MSDIKSHKKKSVDNPDSPENKRKSKRRNLIYYLSIFDKETDDFIGQLVNITTEGIMVVSEHPIETGKYFRLRMTLPEPIEGSDIVEFDAVSKWCTKDINPSFYDIGFEFHVITPKSIEQIKSLMFDFSFHQ